MGKVGWGDKRWGNGCMYVFQFSAWTSRQYEDRLTSKRRIKDLQDIKGTPDSIYRRQLWFNLFKSFIEDILRKE
jgi:hypothetical protein